MQGSGRGRVAMRPVIDTLEGRSLLSANVFVEGSDTLVNRNAVNAAGEVIDHQSGTQYAVSTSATTNVESVVSAADGTHVVVWRTGNGTGHNTPSPTALDVYARIFNADGTPRTAPFLVNENVVGDQTDPDVAISDDGRQVVFAWRNYMPSRTGKDTYPQYDENGTYFRVFNGGTPDPNTGAYVGAGQPLTPETLAHADTGGKTGEYGGQVDFDLAGDFVVAHHGGTGVNVQRYRYTTSLSKLGGMTTNVAVPANPHNFSVALAPDGDMLVVYRKDGVVAGEGISQMVQKLTPTGVGGAYAKAGPAFRVNDTGTSVRTGMNVQTNARVVADADGGFLVTWRKGQSLGNNGTHYVMARYFPTGALAAARPEFQVGENFGGGQRIAIDRASGSFVIHYGAPRTAGEPFDADHYGWAQEYKVTKGVIAEDGSEYLVNPGAWASPQGFAGVAMLPGGAYVGSYGRGDGDGTTGSDVYVRRYAEPTPATGPTPTFGETTVPEDDERTLARSVVG